MMKPTKHGMIQGFILALFIHGVLFFIGGKFFVTPVQYRIQSDDGGIDVDLVTAVSPSGAEAVQSIPSATENQQELVQTVPQEKTEASAQPHVVTAQSSMPTTERQQETVKIMPQEEQVKLPQPDEDTAKSIPSIREKQPETVKPPQSGTDAVTSIASTKENRPGVAESVPYPSQGKTRTQGKPGYFRNQPPEYPQRARQLHQEGLVILRVEVDQKGLPVQVEVEKSSGYELLDQAAIKAVRHWRFQPGRIGDQPIQSRVAIPVRFCLEE